MSEKDGGPAFPCEAYVQKEERKTFLSKKDIPATSGMSLRDWFAGMAMQGFCSHRDPTGVWVWQHQCAEAVVCAYAVADAMLAERKRNES